MAHFGTWAAQVEKATWQPRKTRGALAWAALVIPPTALAWALDRHLATKPVARIALLATTTYFACGAATLRRVSQQIGSHLKDDNLDQARQLLPWLVGRDPNGLNAAGISRAVIESLAENTSDAYTAPILWGAIAGPAGVVAYRAINTLDAMFGHRNEKYDNFGWFSAKADDLANLAPARLTAVLTVIGAWTVNGQPATAINAWRQHAHQHPSPNAGPIEAATAGALGITLGGENTYGDVVENRGTLGWGRPAQQQDISRATTLATWVNVTTTALACGGLGLASYLAAARREPRHQRHITKGTP